MRCDHQSLLEIGIPWRVEASPMSPSDEKRLVLNAKAGDEDSFGELVDHTKKPLARMIHGSLDDHIKHMAEDIAMEAFAKAFSMIREFDFEGEGSFLAWLRAIAFNLAKDRNRRERRKDLRTENATITLEQAGLSHLFEDDEVSPLLELVITQIEKLDYDCRMLLIAVYAYDIPPLQLTRMTGIMMDQGAEESGVSSEVWSRLKLALAPVSKQMIDRNNYCFKKLRRAVTRGGPADSKAGTKRESRRSA